MEISLEEYGKLSDRITELMLENERLRTIVLATQQWVSVNYRLPAYEEPVLLWTYYGEMCIASRSGDGKWYGSYQIIDNAVCWMPLPEPPEVEDKEAD